MISDFTFIFQWWVALFILGLVAFPFTSIIFSEFIDRGYVFGKILGIAVFSYTLFLFATLHILPFHVLSLFFLLLIYIVLSLLFLRKTRILQRKLVQSSWKLFLFEEILFFLFLIAWSFVRGFEPSIHGLEKFMDFGFVNSILRTDYFPAADIWFAGSSINYYYFGHMVTAVLTRFSGLDSFISFNLMIATLCSFTIVGSFSLGLNLFALVGSTLSERHKKRIVRISIICGIIAAFLVAFAGNLHTIYGLFTPYDPDKPVPFWNLAFNGIGEDFFKGYWYPNATRFIPFTIHEFPIYSFVVSDLHGHVLDIPFVLLTLALTLVYVNAYKHSHFRKYNIIFSFKKTKLLELNKNEIPILLLLGFLIAVMYMTNAWDGLIYLVFTSLIFLYSSYYEKQSLSEGFYQASIKAIIIFLLLLLFSLPFSLFFKPSSLVSGVGILCAPQFLIDKGHLGPFLFEPDHCRRSPLYMLLILWGYFAFFAVSFITFILFGFKTFRKMSFMPKLRYVANSLEASDIFVLICIGISALLLVFPELAYMKDIYPEHYRANTMFKLGYQAFIMMSIASSYIFFRIISKVGTYKSIGKSLGILFILLSFVLTCFVSIYPYFAITSYYGNLKTYQGLSTSISFLSNSYHDDYIAIQWLKKNVKKQPIILEAVGDSYTDYARVSAMTGLPTVVGWPVHEWLWRGTYDIPAPRIADVQTIYETQDVDTAKELLKRYHVALIIIGTLERQKYTLLSEDKFDALGDIVFQSNGTKIYQVK